MPRGRALRHPIVIAPITIVVAIVAVWWLALRPEDGATASASTTKQVVAVTSGPMSETVSAEGTVAAAETDDLSFAASGTVTAVNVKAGDTVTAGQVLATIDSAELESEVAAANATVAEAKAKLADDGDAGSSDEQLAADESSLTSANDALANAVEALAGASLVATFDGTVAKVTITAGEELGSGGTGGSTGTGSGSGTGQSSANLGSSSANAGPLAGPSSSSSDSSNTSSAQIQVVSTGHYKVELAVDSADIDQVAVGQTAKVTKSSSSSSRFPGGGAFPGFLLGGGQGGQGGQGGGGGGGTGATGGSGSGGPSATTDAPSATGTVTEVGKVADASSGVATYPVTISFDSTSDDFLVGSTVTGEIATEERANVIQVSSLAVTTANGTSTVEVAANGTTTGPTETRTVSTGLTANGNTEITSGLAAGEKVIITITRPAGAGGFTPGSGNLPSGGPPSGFFRGATGSGG
jgi:multidrug efflux pump subunit AcrA (membrane-fusion protein)